jgi:hypothetical protein
MTTNTEPIIVTTPPERRQIADTIEFAARFAQHVNWDSIALKARELGSNFDVRSANDGSLTITFFWTYEE